MAKSLRSKSKIAARSAKRTSSSSSFKQNEDARLQAISKRLARRKKLPTVTEEKQALEERRKERQRRRDELGEEVDSDEEEAEIARLRKEEEEEEEDGMEEDADVEAAVGKESESGSQKKEITPKISTSGPRTGRHQAMKSKRKKSTFSVNGKAGKGDGKRKHSSSSSSSRGKLPPLRGPGVVGGGGRRKGKK